MYTVTVFVTVFQYRLYSRRHSRLFVSCIVHVPVNGELSMHEGRRTG